MYSSIIVNMTIKLGMSDDESAIFSGQTLFVSSERFYGKIYNFENGLNNECII